MNGQPAILLIGPTGSGKTPIGQHLQQHGICGRSCLHFDFGAELRRIDRKEYLPPGFTSRELNIISGILEHGALFEKETFFVVKDILRFFTQKALLRDNCLLILNGLPRHTEQAEMLAELLEMTAVVYLNCSASVVFERIQSNSGGDRTDRTDDSIEMVQKKLEIFQNRTLPLLEFYRERKVDILTVEIEVDTTPEDVFRQLTELLA